MEVVVIDGVVGGILEFLLSRGILHADDEPAA